MGLSFPAFLDPYSRKKNNFKFTPQLVFFLLSGKRYILTIVCLHYRYAYSKKRYENVYRKPFTEPCGNCGYYITLFFGYAV